MAILDSQGRLFGKYSVLDVAAALIMLSVVAGIFILPGSKTIAQGAPIEVDVMVRGLSARDPGAFLKPGEKVSVVIRNEPAGEVSIKEITTFKREIAVPQPDGTLKLRTDPRPEMQFSNDMMMTLTGSARQGDDGGYVFGNKKVKVGTSLELEGKTFNFNSSIIAIRGK